MTLFNLYYDITIIVLVTLVAMAIVDENFASYLNLKSKIAFIELRKQLLLLRMKPDLWLMKWRMKRVLKKLQADQELQAMVKEHQEMMDARDRDSNLP